jgi:hypothetical protein
MQKRSRKIAGITGYRRHRAGSEEPDMAANKRE